MPMPRCMSDLVGGGVLLGASAVLYAQTVGKGFAHAEIARDPVWYPRLILVLLAAASIGLIVRGLAGRADNGGSTPVWGRFLAVAAAVTAYFLLFDVAGFLLASLVFLPAMTVLLGYRRPLVIGLVAVIFVALVWYCFAEIFVIRPPGFGLDELFAWL